MEQILKIIREFDVKKASMVYGGLGIAFLLFFLILPMVSAGGGFISISISGSNLLFGGLPLGFKGFLLWVGFLATIGAVVWSYVQKKVDFIVPCVAVGCILLGSILLGFGFGWIIELLIGAAWILVAQVHKGKPFMIN